MITLAWFFESVWGRRILFVGGVAICWFVIREHYIRKGEEQARVSAAQQQLQQQTQEMQAERKNLLDTITQATSAIEAATQAIAASQARVRVIQNEITSLAGQRKEANATLAKIPDSELHTHIVQQLALRPLTDTTPGYLPSEERAISQCLTNQPLCEENNTLLNKQIAELQIQTHETGGKYNSLLVNYQAVLGYTGKLEQHYTVLYNTFAAKKRSVKCLWLWHCQKQTIPTPSPKDLALPTNLLQVSN